MSKFNAIFSQQVPGRWLLDTKPDGLAEFSASRIIVVFVAIAVVVLVSNILYNLYLHPLAQFPGPWLARASLIWRLVYSMQGRFHRCINQGHLKYGPMFRVSPNELSFASKESWKDIYGFKSEQPGKETHRKSGFYDIFCSGYKTTCVGSEQDPRKHAQMKKNLSPAFSAKAILEQEMIIRQCIDQFVQRVDSDKTASTKGIDLTEWYAIVAFDIFGEMAFGESFHAIEAGKPHFWPKLILNHLFFVNVMDNLRRVPLLLYLGKKILPRLTTATRDKHSLFTRERLERRLRDRTARKDFLTNLIDNVGNGKIDEEEMLSHVSTLVIAGAETTATCLASVTSFLLRSPSTYNKLVQEIRTVFTSYDEITAAKAQDLPYLQAVIQEGLRIHPPGSYGFPRLSSGAYIGGYWVPKGVEIYTSGWSVTHSDQYFHDPFTFQPERWLEENNTDDLKASHPFSLGPRECIGKSFALLQVSLMLACLVFKYDLNACDKDLDWEAECRLHVRWWKPALWVLMTPRPGID